MNEDEEIVEPQDQLEEPAAAEIEAQAHEAVATEAAPVVEGAPVAQAEAEGAAYVPAVPKFDLTGMSAEQEEEINTLFYTNPAAAMVRVFEHQQRQAMQANAVADYHLTTAEIAAPDYFRTHRNTINAARADQPANIRGTEQGARLAMLAPIWADFNQTGDLKGAILRAARLIEGGQRQQTPPVKPAAAPLPPAQRVPGATSGPATGRAAPTAQRGGEPDDATAKRLAAHMDIPIAQARRMLEDER